MLDELRSVLGNCPTDATHDEYLSAIHEDNCLGKRTAATRRLSSQRLSELYALDPKVPLFRVMQRCWYADREGHAASSWTQSGHLKGRGRKVRQRVLPTPVATAYALLLGHLAGKRKGAWETLCMLLKHADQFPQANELGAQAEAVKSERRLLDASDPVPDSARPRPTPCAWPSPRRTTNTSRPTTSRWPP